MISQLSKRRIVCCSDAYEITNKWHRGIDKIKNRNRPNALSATLHTWIRKTGSKKNGVFTSFPVTGKSSHLSFPLILYIPIYCPLPSRRFHASLCLVPFWLVSLGAGSCCAQDSVTHRISCRVCADAPSETDFYRQQADKMNCKVICSTGNTPRCLVTLSDPLKYSLHHTS